jgi:hypothetical protein
VVAVLVGHDHVTDRIPSGARGGEGGFDRALAAADPRVNHGGLAVTHQQVRGHEPEIHAVPLEATRVGRL